MSSGRVFRNEWIPYLKFKQVFLACHKRWENLNYLLLKKEEIQTVLFKIDR